MPPIPAKKSVTYSDPKHAPAIKADDSIELSFRNEVLPLSSSKLTGNSVIINPAANLIPNTNHRVPIPLELSPILQAMLLQVPAIHPDSVSHRLNPIPH